MITSFRTIARKSSIGGFTFVRGALRSCMGAWHSTLTKIPLIYAVSYFNLRGLELSLGGRISPPNPPGATGMASLLDCFDILYSFHHVFFKENVKYPIWACRDPISLILGTRFSLILGTRRWFSLILGTRFSNLGTRIGSLNHLKKPLFT